MQSAIAKHLQCPRSQAKRVADDYAPPYPAWVAGNEAVQQAVMAYFGIQWRGTPHRAAALDALNEVASSFSNADGPKHFDRAHYADAAGYDTLVAIAYWTDPAAYKRWSAGKDVADWWARSALESGPLGFFREILSPHVARFETLFSTQDRLEGIGVAMGAVSPQDIQEHGYWGSMRERLALAQTDALSPTGTLASHAPTDNGRVRISGHRNVAVIRSGQEWTETHGNERDLYVERMEPTLRAGMDFLRDHGGEIGCYFNRYMRLVDRAGRPLEKSFGLSYWRSLADMEKWAEFHPTHVAIFGTFMEIVQQLQFDLCLRLYHEVSVVEEDEQQYEYVNCHPATGLMRAAPI